MNSRFYYDTQFMTDQHPKTVSDLFKTRSAAEKACKHFLKGEETKYDATMVYQIEILGEDEEGSGLHPTITVES